MVLHTTTNLRFLAMLALVGALYFTPSTADAQGLAIKVQPSTIEERLDPGQTVSGEFFVTNENGGTQTYFIGTQNIVSQDENGRPIFSELSGDDPLEAAAWVVPSEDTVTLDVGQTAVIPYTITVPQNASPGSYFAAIFVTREADKATESGAGVGFQVASTITLRVNGTAVEGLTVNEFATDRSVYTNRTLGFSVRMTNTGTIHQRPVGIVSIADMFGNELTITPPLMLNENGGTVMPREERTFTASWTNDRFMIGRYTATLSTVYGESDRLTVLNRTSFWVLPVRVLGILVGGLVVLILITMMALRAYIRRALTRAGVSAHSGAADRIESFLKRLMRTLAWCAVLIMLLFIGMVVFFA